MCPTCVRVLRHRMAPCSISVTSGYLSPGCSRSSLAFWLPWPDSRMLRKGAPACNPWICTPFASLTRDLVNHLTLVS